MSKSSSFGFLTSCVLGVLSAAVSLYPLVESTSDASSSSSESSSSSSSSSVELGDYSIEITPSEASLEVGSSVTLTATIYLDGEEQSESDLDLGYYSEAGLSLWWWEDSWGTVAPDGGASGGTVSSEDYGNLLSTNFEASAVGTYYIVAELENHEANAGGSRLCTAYATITYYSYEDYSVAILLNGESPNTLALDVGDEASLSAVTYDENGSVSSADSSYKWVSANENIVTVDENGLVTAVGEGSTSITATGAVTEKSSTLVVSSTYDNFSVTISGDEISDGTIYGDVRNTYQLSAVTLNADSEDFSESYEWNSGSTNIVTVDENGLATAVGEGSTSITVTGTTSGQSASITFSADYDNFSVLISGDDVSAGLLNLTTGGTSNLSVSSADATGTSFEENYEWEMGEETIATVSDGTVTGVATGVTTLTVTGATSQKAAVLTVVVENALQVTITGEHSVTVNSTITLTGAVTNNGETVDGASLSWSSGSETIATVDSSGMVTGLSAGTVLISATYTDSSGDSSTGNYTVVVTAQDYSGYSVTVSGYEADTDGNASLSVGSTLTLSATTISSTSESLSEVYAWRSTSSTVASLDVSSPNTASQVTLTGLSAGTTIITCVGATTGQSATLTVIVSIDYSNYSVSVTSTADSVSIGSSLTLFASTRDGNGNSFSEGHSWTSGDESIATVDSLGIVTGLSAGNVTITATGADSGKTGTYDITVDYSDCVVSLSGYEDNLQSSGNVLLYVENTLQLSASTVDGGQQSFTENYSWDSSDESLATVSNGLVTANSSNNTGNVTITATGDTTGKTASIIFDIQIDYSGYTVSVSGDETSVGIGSSITYTATTLDNHSENFEETYQWSSSDSNIASVNYDSSDTSTVNIIGRATGTVTITATGNTSGQSGASAEITVNYDGCSVSISTSTGNDYVYIGETVTMEATTFDGSGDEIEEDHTFTIDSNDYATIDSSSGLLTANSNNEEGTVVVTATGVDTNLSSTYSLKVSIDYSEYYIEVGSTTDNSGYEASVRVGDTMTLTATTYDPQGNEFEEEYEWATQDDSVISISYNENNSSTATITGVSNGACFIYVYGLTTGQTGSQNFTCYHN